MTSAILRRIIYYFCAVMFLVNHLQGNTERVVFWGVLLLMNHISEVGDGA